MGVDGERASAALVPDKLDDGGDDGQQQTYAEHDEESQANSPLHPSGVARLIEYQLRRG